MTDLKAFRVPLLEEVSVQLQKKNWDVVVIPDDMSNRTTIGVSVNKTFSSFKKENLV
jgi:hypothetical protein